MTPFENNWEYLAAELELLDLLIKREVILARRLATTDHQQVFKGLFISDGEIDRLLDDAKQTPDEILMPDALLKAAAAGQEQVALRRKASLEAGVYLTLPHLARLFSLTPFEEQIVLICLAPELDLKYAKLFAYLQDDLRQNKPSVELILKLSCRTTDERLRARPLFSPQATLFRSRILRPLGPGDAFLLSQPVKLEERIVNFLTGTAWVEPEFAASISAVAPNVGWNDLRWPDQLKTGLLEVTKAHLQGSPRQRLIYHFYGPHGTGKKSLAAALCHELNIPLLIVDVQRLSCGAQSIEEAINTILREAVLRPTAIYLEHFDHLAEREDKAVFYHQSIARAIEEFSWLTFIATEKSWEPAGLFKQHLFLSLELAMPEMETRVALWKTLAQKNITFETKVDWGDVATKFRLTPGQMEAALIAARNYAHLRGGADTPVSKEDLYRGCRAQSNQKLATLSRKLCPRHKWADIILPPNSIAQLRELCANVKHRRKVYSRWGFARKLSLRKGLCALFYGPSGTGKTMAVEIIAQELHLEAFKIDLSTVVSKYIGETEKNLSKIFQEAETSNAIVFFDEADALFGKRSEVKDAHDRYANIEINYLLQRIEEFDGIAILATNLRKNIDDAFFRRMDFAVEFPFPDESHRYRIWRQHFPRTAPLAPDVDFDFLATRLNIAGGNIKNIAIGAAFLAAGNSGVIHMEHIIRATRREYEKIGRLCSEMEFAPYHSWLTGS